LLPRNKGRKGMFLQKDIRDGSCNSPLYDR
jgi:hypothetical protein